MTRRLFYILCLWFGLALTAQAEVIVLRSGQVIKGEIILNNEEVVILRQKDGLRYQYPQTEVVSISMDTPAEIAMDTMTTQRPKRVDIGLSAYGGIALVPHKGTGATAEVHAMVGSHNLLNRQVFLGGSLGYRGIFVGEHNYSWIPLQLVLQFPIALNQSPIANRPLIGGSLGYAFATNKEWGSGVCADIHMGWCFQRSERSSLSLALKAQWQQTAITIEETIHDTPYSNHVGCSILSLGVSLGLRF